MTDPSADYIARELAHTLRPAELYRIWRPGTGEWTYTSGDTSVTYNGKTYTPAAIQRGAVSRDADFKTSRLNISINYLKEPIVNFLVNWPVELVWIEVLRLFRDDATEARVVFLGQVARVSIQGRKAQVECVGFEHFLRQSLPILRYQVQCNRRLFSVECGIANASYKITTTVSVSADGLTLTDSAFGDKADNYFTWGYVQKDDDRRLITAHTGNDISLRYRIYGLTGGDTVTAYAGCDRTFETCKDKFDNRVNFSGFPWIPLDNPVTQLPAPTRTGGKK